ncbi:Nitrilase, partial [Massospora cicadina]
MLTRLAQLRAPLFTVAPIRKFTGVRMKPRVAAAQFCATEDVGSNFRVLEALVAEARRERGQRFKESAYTKAGEMCYDLRFPELSQTLRLGGAQVLAYPSVARAIETQSYVIAPGQAGKPNANRASYGHTMVVDPWGEVLATCGAEPTPSICTGEVDLEFLARVREAMPLAAHRKPDLYYRNFNLHNA